MYCRFCGKEIEEDSVFCGKCGAPVGKTETPVKKEEEVEEPFFMREQSAPAAEPFFAEEKPLPVGNPRMVGFGKALTGTILSFVALTLYLFVCEICILSSYDDDFVAALFLLFGAIAMGVISVVFGAKSIGTFKRAQEQKPIATLILGIVSLAQGALGLFCDMIIFFPLLALL